MGRRASAVLVVLGVATGCGSGGALGQSTAPEVQGSPPTTVADLTGTTVEPSGQSTNADPGTTSVVVTGIAPTEVATTATTAVGAPQAQLYETMTVVLESPQHGPSLCVGGMLDSMPPQCGDIPLVGWDWGMVDSEQTVNGTTWFDYQDQVVVTGTYDGATFTLASVRKPTAAELEAERPVMDLEAPCPEPAGGWLAQAARHPPLVHGSADLFPGVPQYLATQPDSAGMWVDYSLDPGANNDPMKMILVVRFTGDLARHEADLRAIYPGALCVAQAPKSEAELAKIASELASAISNGVLTLDNGIALRVMSYSQDVGNTFTGTVDLGVIAVPPGAQEYFDQRYGAGVVRLQPSLRRVV